MFSRFSWTLCKQTRKDFRKILPLPAIIASNRLRTQTENCPNNEAFEADMTKHCSHSGMNVQERTLIFHCGHISHTYNSQRIRNIFQEGGKYGEPNIGQTVLMGRIRLRNLLYPEVFGNCYLHTLP